MNYKIFDKYILRTPLLSLNEFYNLFDKRETSFEELIEVITRPQIFESIYIASPHLYNEIQKLLKPVHLSNKKQDRLKKTIIKYISRLCSRSTPFGLFAGCSLGYFAEQNKIILDRKYHRVTRLDMNFLVNLSTKIADDDNIKKQLSFYTNTTLYSSHKNYRYLEYQIINEKRSHQMVEIKKNKYLNLVINLSKTGISFRQLIDKLRELGVTEDAAVKYLNTLIKNQIIVSELEPSVSTMDYLGDLITIISNLKGTDILINYLKEIKNSLAKIDQNIYNEIREYNYVINIINKLDVEYNISKLFQVDVNTRYLNNELNKDILFKINKAIKVLEIIDNSENVQSESLQEFLNQFSMKYGDKKISLSNALDNEIGINYGINSEIVNPLIDDIHVYKKNKSLHELRNKTYSDFFNKKILAAFKNNLYAINIFDEEIQKFEKKPKYLSNTFSCMIQLININGKLKIKLNSIGGSSAANLMARFCASNNDIFQFVKEIIKKEEQLETGINAEIVHLPESRVGNVLMRPPLRKYEIPYLAKSNLNVFNQLYVNDIYINIIDNQIKIFSKKLKKEIKPKLTNAHNFHLSTLPIYKFLCDMQNYMNTDFLSFNTDELTFGYDFIPRIEYNDIIFSEATWKIGEKDLIDYNFNDKNKLLINFEIFRKAKNIPSFVLLVESDNKLLLNLKNIDFIDILLHKIKKNKYVVLSEFLFSEECIVQDHKGKNFTNEIIISFYKDENTK